MTPRQNENTTLSNATKQATPMKIVLVHDLDVGNDSVKSSMRKKEVPIGSYQRDEEKQQTRGYL